METKRIHNLIEQGQLVQRTSFLHCDNIFSQSASPEPNTKEPDNFSHSKAMLVGDCSKRALAIDRNLTVPPKKRKQIHEELDLCDVFADQNLPKSKTNEKDMSFCLKLEKENLCASVASEKGLDEGKIELSLQSSIYVKADDSAEWSKLKCFDGISVDGSNSAVFFAGGPIQSSAFCIMPHDMKVDQYIAVAAGNIIYNNLSYNNTEHMSGIIQFWNVGSLHERKMLNQSPSMELALYHDNGIITQMKWCPADCYDKCPSTCHLPRLGLLAASSSNSNVYIYSVPQPDFMPKSKLTFPIYFTLPFMKLIPLFGGPSFTTRKSVATCIEWEKNGERIVAGYGNGAVCVWMLKVSSCASHIAVENTEQSYIIQPYLFFQASGASIVSLSLASFNNHRWLVVSSIDKTLRFFDLLDTSAPFHVVKQGFENSGIWGDTFCGVYSSPSLNSLGLISLSAKDCCAESNDKGIQKGLFDSSTCVAVSEKKNLHAIADMSGAVTVNVLKNIHKPLETSYLTYMVFETAVMALDSADLELKSSKYCLSISGSIPSNDKDVFDSKIKQGSSSSSSGFCSPKHGKTIVIDMTQCVNVSLLESSPRPSMKSYQDINNNGIETFLNKPFNSDEETGYEMKKCSESSEDLMHDLLMVKITNQSKFSSHKLLFNISNNSACCNSKGAKDASDGALITSAASDYTGDTIIYPIEPCFCDTSHPNLFKSVKSNEQSTGDDKENEVHETVVCKKNDTPAIKTEFLSENSLGFSSNIKLENSCSGENSSSKNWHEPSVEKCNLDYKCRNLKKINYDCNLFHSNDYHVTSKHSDISGKEWTVLNKCSKEIMKSGDAIFLNQDANDDFNLKKDAIKPSSHKTLINPLCDVPVSNNLNQPKPLPDMCSIITSNYLICDKDNRQVSDRALIQSSSSDYSGDTVIYFPDLYDFDKANYLEIEKPGATFQSLCKSEKENTFQDTLLLKMDEKDVTNESKIKLLTEKCSSCSREKCEHFFTKESLKYNSEYETDSASCNSSDDDRNFFPNKFLLSDFHPLHSEYLCEKSEDKYTELNKLPGTNENPQKLSYESLIASFGVVFKNNLDESPNPLKQQENDIYIKYNPLSVIKTMSWDPNEGCQSWLFVGGNSGIGRLVFVPDFPAGRKKKHHPIC